MSSFSDICKLPRCEMTMDLLQYSLLLLIGAIASIINAIIIIVFM